jgi:hypothetical protein
MSSTSATIKLATMATALALLVQIAARCVVIDPMLVAFAIALFLATALVPRFWTCPVEWVLSAAMIIAAANGGTNMAANVQERSTDEQHAALNIHMASIVYQGDTTTNKPPPRIIRW